MGISVGSVSVDVVPSVRGFAADLKAKLAGLRVNIPVDVDTSKVREQVEQSTKSQRPKIKVAADTDAFSAKVRTDAAAIAKTTLVSLPITADGERLRRDITAQAALISELVKIEIPVDIEDATKLRTKMAVELDVLKAMAAAADPTVNIDVDTGAAQAKIAALGAESKVAGSGISGMVAGLLLLGPALVPIVAAAAGLGLAFGAPLAAAGGGLTIFGLIAGKEIANTNKVAKQITDLKKRAASLVDPKARADALSQAKALEASLTGPQKAFLAAKDALAGGFKTLTDKTGGAIFRPIIAAMRLLGTLMPQLAPIVRSVSGALTGMVKEIGKSAKSGGLKDFLAFLGKMSGPTLTGVGVILGNIATGFGGLFKAFAPVAGSLTSGLLGLSGAFADFGRNAGKNKGLQSFITYVQQVGPQVAATIGSLVKAIVHIGVALAPLGSLVLGGIKLLSVTISAIPTPILNALLTLIVAVVVALKAWAIVQGVLDALLDANPIGLIVIAIAALVTGLILAYQHSETFRKIVDAAFKGIAAAIDFVVNHWKLLLILITGPFGAAIVGVIDHFKAVESVARTVFKFIVGAFLAVVGAIVNGAAKAFGWVPGIGGKLKAAAAKFNEFRDSVNAALDGIHPEKTIYLNVVSKKQSVNVPSINKPRVQIDGAGATGAIVRRPTVALIGESGPEALVPLSQTAGNSPLPTGSSITQEQSSYRAFKRALADTGTVIMSKPQFDALDLLVTG